MKLLIIISISINFLFSYNIFNHSHDFKISTNSFVASFENDNRIYNFLNPACNSNSMDHMYSILGSKFNGILENQQLYFSLHTPLLENIYIGLLRTSIDDIFNTSNAWEDYNQNGNVEVNEIDYGMITTFSHTNIGVLISKPFKIKNYNVGINTKFDILSILDEKSLSHSFDFGIIKKYKKIKIGLVFKDFLNQTYWTTGYQNNIDSKIIFGSNFNFKNFNNSIDINFLNGNYMMGTSYFYNDHFSLLLSKSSLEKINLGFYIKYKKYNIGYCYIIPQNNDLGYSQRVLIGISNI